MQKLKPLIDKGLSFGLSQDAVSILLIRDATRALGRSLNNNEVAKIKNIVLNRVKNTNKNVSIERETDLRDIFNYLYQNANPFLLQNKEQILAIIPAVGLREPRSIRKSKGVYGGPSFKITKGVYFKTGGFTSSSESHEELRNIDGGDLFITNQKIFFVGKQRTVNILFKKLISIEADNNSIVVHKDGRERAQYFIWPSNLIKIKIDGQQETSWLTGNILQEIIQKSLKINQ